MLTHLKLKVNNARQIYTHEHSNLHPRSLIFFFFLSHVIGAYPYVIAQSNLHRVDPEQMRRLEIYLNMSFLLKKTPNNVSKRAGYITSSRQMFLSKAGFTQQILLPLKARAFA